MSLNTDMSLNTNHVTLYKLKKAQAKKRAAKVSRGRADGKWKARRRYTCTRVFRYVCVCCSLRSNA